VLDPGSAPGNLINVASPRDANLIRVIPGNPSGSFIIQKLEGTQTLVTVCRIFGRIFRSPRST